MGLPWPSPAAAGGGLPAGWPRTDAGWPCVQVRARPEFVHVMKNGQELNALKFHLEVEMI
jgi:hypothetical protein